MLDLTTVLIGLLVFLVVYWYLDVPSNIPPYPGFRIPILGNMASTISAGSKGNLIGYLTDLSKQYGSVYSMWFGAQLVVFINDYENFKEAMVTKGDHFVNRPNWMIIVEKVFKKKGLIFVNGDNWKEMRRYALTTMRDMGLGKRSLEARIQEEAEYLTKEFLKYEAKPFSAALNTQNAVSNIICTLCFGKRFNYDDEQFVDLMNKIRVIASRFSIAVPQNFIPLTKYLPLPKSISEVLDHLEEVMQHVERQVDEHTKSYDDNNVRDLVDLYIKKEKEQEHHTEDDIFSKLNLKRTVMDLFLAGTETTSTTLAWCILYMIAYPDIQEKCHGMIDEEIGSNRSPNQADRANLPYIVAFIQEIQRLCSVTPLGVPRASIDATSIGDYSIPRRTLIFINQAAMHHDPKYWNQPNLFNPDRWIKDGQLIKHESFAPFGMGNRACIGEQLARLEIFIFLTTILQKFTLRKEEGSTLNLEPHLGITMAPYPYNVVMVAR